MTAIPCLGIQHDELLTARKLLQAGRLDEAERLILASPVRTADAGLIALQGEIRFRRADFDGAAKNPAVGRGGRSSCAEDRAVREGGGGGGEALAPPSPNTGVADAGDRSQAPRSPLAPGRQRACARGGKLGSGEAIVRPLRKSNPPPPHPTP